MSALLLYLYCERTYKVRYVFLIFYHRNFMADLFWKSRFNYRNIFII